MNGIAGKQQRRDQNFYDKKERKKADKQAQCLF
jgi:hypothetical protein